MTQETRKDPRAKVLTMTVRYKSATLDEFIEHHSHDVSRGGMFIKTPSPFPPGTLLKFEVKIAGEQRVMQGVGRVVWKREASEVSESRPAGMGVKFIKIDDESRKVIDQLVAARGSESSAFDQGADGAQPVRAPAPTSTSQVVAPPVAAARDTGEPKARKATMIGLGAMQSEPDSAEAAAAEAFFPPTQPEAQMPPPEDRTVMKQAAELLQDALREAGGSLEEVGAAAKEAPARDVPKAEPVSVKTPAAPVKAESTPPPAAQHTESERSVIVNAKPREEVTQPAVRRSSVAPASGSGSASNARRSEPPRARPAPAQEAAAEGGGGGGRLALALVAVLAAGGVVYFLQKPKAEAPTAAESPAVTEPAPAPEPTPAPTAATQEAATEPAATAAAEPTASAAPEASAAPDASAAPEASAAPDAKAAADAKALKPTPAPAPAPRPRPQAKPKPAAPEAEAPAQPAPAEPAAPATPPAETTPAPKPAEATPPAEAPAAAPKPAAPKPAAPKPAAPPADTSGDNPY